MKYPIFERMGQHYPVHLETQFDRILSKIAELWNTPELHDYFSDLLIDKRSGRKGFPAEVMADLMRVWEFRRLENFRAAERKADAVRQLEASEIAMTKANFFRAFEAGDKQVIDLFVRAGIKLPAEDEDGTPLLLSALKRGLTVIATIILDASVDVNVRDNLGLTPLLIACGKPIAGYQIIAEKLIAKGANVNARDGLGNTPLLLALTGGMLDIARLLILNGANVSARSRTGESPLSVVMKNYRGAEATEIAELLVSRHAVE
ncbi:ankyrin repeat domain-containing protein [uncultured Thiodictyon sp.]|uniref:ankyrin repeat domain-containing protein n=1 Tax=uncultured Thiodictyon sp. TaxID=1846217 RepID=UPI0025E4C93E|nr:ankyrin repeat domain-containing protein [uncultured Thiodictyon sp.]